MGLSLDTSELSNVAIRVVLYLFRHLFNLYEIMIDDLIEDDRYQAAEYIIKNFINKTIKNTTNYRERLLRMEYIIEHPQEKALHKKVVS